MARLTKLSRSVAGKVAIVTGAASGMGRATAHLLSDEGAKVAVVDLDPERVAVVVKEITDAGGEAEGFDVDVSDLAAVKALVAGVVERFGGVDILINNAGVSIPASAADASDDEFDAAWQRTIAVNLTAQALLVRAALPYLRASTVRDGS